MQCPVCREVYSIEDIGDHVDQCLSLINETDNNSSINPKRSFPFETSDQPNPTKKYKADPVINTETTNKLQPKTMSTKEHIPLAEKMRPKHLSDYIGQKQVVGCSTVLQQLITKGHIPSMILWGPPGCGKSSLANVIACLSKEIHKDKVIIIKLSAVTSNVGSIKEAVSSAKNASKLNRQTIVFMDEIHRFNKLQQDIFLPHVEAGTFTLIGTTTENPSYSLNSALLSRCRVFGLNKLEESDIIEILSKAIPLVRGQIFNEQDDKLKHSQNELNSNDKPDFVINKTVVEWLAEVCDGDARVALNGLELAVKTMVLDRQKCSHDKSLNITLEDIQESLQQAHMLSDKQTNHTHHLYSALAKSIKGDDANASLYWLARLMAIKEDPVNIARRLVRISSEAVGLADLDALDIAVHTMHGCQMIGMPECDLLLGQCVVYLCRAPKSRLVYNALKSAEKTIINHKGPQPDVPSHIKDRSAQGKLQHLLRQNNLIHKEENVETRLPLGLEHANFFVDE